MSPIDSTLWNGMENYSPRSRIWLESCVPLYHLDELMGLNPFKNSIKFYDPTTTPAPLISKVKTSEETKEVCAAVGSEIYEAKGNIIPVQQYSSGDHLPFPLKITDLNFGAPPDIGYEEEEDLDEIIDF
jgi:hypothetical protein